MIELVGHRLQDVAEYLIFAVKLLITLSLMQKLKSDIQKTILDAAEYLFTRKGYKNTSMREIATKAECY